MSFESLLIVGGTGFIGRNLVLKSLDSGYLVSVLSFKEPLASSKIKNVNYIHCDLTDFDRLKKKLSNYSFDFVINLGGYVDHSNFLNGGMCVINTHLIGTLNLLKIINWSSIKMFVQIGTSDEYGKNDAPQNESMAGLPISPYSFSKLASSIFLQMLHRKNNFPMVVIRLFLVYGPGQNHDRFIPQVIRGCMSGNKFPVSKGEQLRDFCFIDDITRGILLCLKNKKVMGEIINLGSGNPTSIKSVISQIKNIIGKGKPSFGDFDYREDENMQLYADISKAKNLLKWRPFISLEEGLKKTIYDFKE